MKISTESKCHLWTTSVLTRDDLRNALEPDKVYEDSSHLERCIMRCRQCGQLYFYEFYEIVDWDDGDDAMYFTWIPVDDVETADVLSRLSPMDLTQFPSVRRDFPPGAEKATGPYHHKGLPFQVEKT